MRRVLRRDRHVRPLDFAAEQPVVNDQMTNDFRNTSRLARHNRPIRSRRHGFLLIEMVVALILVGTVATVLPVALNAVYRQRQQERFERLAQLELSNVVTRLELAGSAVEVDDIQLSGWFQDMYPDASVEIVPGVQATNDIPTIPFTVSILRPRGDSQPPLKQQLITWLERRQEGALH
jgi:type II secretory pathway pseudopilin PulG